MLEDESQPQAQHINIARTARVQYVHVQGRVEQRRREQAHDRADHARVAAVQHAEDHEPVCGR